MILIVISWGCFGTWFDGVMTALLINTGIKPCVGDWDNISLVVGAYAAAQCIKTEEGIPSGPAAEVEKSSLIESTITVSVR